MAFFFKNKKFQLLIHSLDNKAVLPPLKNIRVASMCENNLSISLLCGVSEARFMERLLPEADASHC